MSLVTRYSLVGIAVTASFVNFISCGSQMYKASLAEDHTISDEVEANSKDPTSAEFGLHAPGGWEKLPIVYSVESKLDKIQVSAMQAAMATWEKAVGKKLFSFNPVPNASGSAFPTLEGALRDQVNGHYDEKSWRKSGKKNE
ncbi:MAG: hypothetical protein NTV34_19640, partial [Proteobacteria bacterium]|nr:hypothetical protein [Pseudomonadota bacterium]